VTGSIAIKAYQEAPFQRKATLFLSNVVFLGPLGSGKTSLLRTFTGKTFRLIEPPSQHISFSSSYHDLADWLPVVGGLVYEDELCRLIVEDLLKHVHSMLTSSSKMSSPSYALGGALGGRGVGAVGGSTPGAGGGVFVGGAPPPPLPPPRQRSQSYSDSNHNKVEDFGIVATKASNRLSASFEVIESGSPEGRLQLGARPQPVAENKPIHPRRLHLSRQGKSLIDKLISPRLRRSFRVKGSNIRRHHSDSVRATHLTVSDDHAIPTRKAANGSVPAASTYQSNCPLPEQLIEKIKKELQQSTDGTLTQKYHGKLIDIPGGGAFQVFKHLFITDSSICVLTFDISKDILSVPSPGPRRRSPSSLSNGSDPFVRPSSENSHITPSRQGSHTQPVKASYLNQLLTTIGDICLQWSHSNSDLTVRGARIILVGTHSDKVPSSVSHRNFELLRKEIKGSPYEKYVSMTKFVVSSSSIIERSSIDDLKHFIMDCAKKVCRVQVPLKWLRCVRRFQAFSAKKSYIMSMAEARKIVAEVCDITQPEEITGVIQFLHHNHIILCFERIHQLKEIVITDCKWFASHMSAVFKAGYFDLMQKGAPVELHSDQELLRSRGILTSQLLDFLWRDKETQKHKEELLTLMHKMDILCCMTSETSPFSFTTSIEDLTLDSNAKKRKKSNISAGVLSSVIVPSLVEESAPPHFISLPSFKAEPVVFRFKQGHVPSSLFQRLLVRCVQSYPNDYALYRDAATFEVDSVSLLMLTMGKDFIRVSLHRIRSGSEAVSPTLDITDLDSLMSPNLRSPCPDVCMAILMFVQATISDLIQQWMPNLSYDLCVLCNCKSQVERDVDVDHARKLSTMSTMSEPVTTGASGGGDHFNKVGDASATSRSGVLPAWNSSSSNEDHYIVLSDMDNMLQHSFLRCEAGNQVPSSASLLCWFGEVPPIPSGRSTTSPVEDSGELSYTCNSYLFCIITTSVHNYIMSPSYVYYYGSSFCMQH
jgi:GTPase SAR1 family protein